MKSAVTDYFLDYFEKNRINISQISEKTGIKEHKFERNYKVALTADEFLRLCAMLAVEPEEVLRGTRQSESN